MKTILIFLLLSVTFCTKLKAQSGSDFIISIDNSGSINQQDFADISANVEKLIDQILRCNKENRVAIVHYGTGLLNSVYTGNESPKIYIESDFTNDLTTALNFTRRLTFGDHYHEAVDLIGDALDNAVNTNILSPQQNLNHNPNVPLVMILFTDAQRASGSLQGGSYLVNYFNPTYGTPAAFENFTEFKNNRDAKFVVFSKGLDSFANDAAASISSSGGSYFGTIENNNSDPTFGALPRFFYPQPNFLFDPANVNEVLENFCTFNGYVKFFYEKQTNCNNPANPFYGSIHDGKFVLPHGSTYLDMGLVAINLADNSEITVNFNPLIVGNTFHYQIQPTDISPIPLSGNYQLRLDLKYLSPTTGVQTISGYNNYYAFYLGEDITYGINCRSTNLIKSVNSIKSDYLIDKNANPNNIVHMSVELENDVFPNPSSGIFKVSLKNKESGMIEIYNMSGQKIYNKTFENTDLIDINFSNKIKGIYQINIITTDNKKTSKRIVIY